MVGMQSGDARSTDLKWLADNRSFLEEHHAGKWLAIEGYELVGLGNTLKEAAQQAEDRGFKDPLFTAVRAKKYQDLIMFRRWR